MQSSGDTPCLNLDMRYDAPLVVVCAGCRRVKADNGKWEFKRREILHGSQVSHGICPICAQYLYPELFDA